jgi:NAD(P)-dependent dehydrogenase (short-subunit alcohol dehydrogenase family)
MRDLNGRVAVVTGAAGGIGLGIAEAFHAEGMKVMLADVTADGLARAVDRFAERRDDVASFVVDVADVAQVEALADAVVDRFGAVHVVCNNAGIIRSGRTWELPLETWNDVLRVNLFGVLHGVHTFVPRLLASGEEGHVVNVASMAAVVPVPGIGPYNVSKHGVLALTEVLQAELAAMDARIGVTIVFPGRVPSNLGRPPGEGPSASVAPLQPGELSPREVGRQVVEAIRANQLHLFTHPERVPEVVARFARITDSPTL